jgi:hypothetical protein
VPQPLRWRPHGAVELARCVLPGDDGGQLDDLVVGEVPTQLPEEVVVDVAIGECDRVGIGERGPLAVIE